MRPFPVSRFPDRPNATRAAARVAVIGAGIAGMACAVELAARGLQVVVLERAETPGGKLREVQVAGTRVDVGPTVLTMRWVFDELFAAAGESLEQHLTLRRLNILARHAWDEREHLDLFADREQTKNAIGEFAGATEARGYEDFARRAREIYRTLEEPFIRSQRPSVPGLVGRVGWRRLGDLLRIKPFETLWGVLGEHFRDPRLRQLFARYATYCGSSPFAAPATMMLIAHVEQEGVWSVAGGMHQLAVTLARVAAARGAELRFESEVRDVTVKHGRACGVILASGEYLPVDAIVANADASAIAAGLLGRAIAPVAARVLPERRSLSALTWAVHAQARGFALTRHNVFFSGAYESEFEQIFKRRQLPADPTVYVCAQDRDCDATPIGPERLFCLINAPADGDLRDFNAGEIEQCERRTFKRLECCGLTISQQHATMQITTPNGFNRLFPGTGGALYGRATHGWQASFRRPGARTQLSGLYLAGGSVHPGPGVPMAALSGRLAAAALMADLDLISRSHGVVTRGGMSMR
jgi:1-hydroxycarotenoid 3,4-desaturase